MGRYLRIMDISEKLRARVQKTTDTIHTEAHDIADQMYSYYEKKEKFGLLLGLVRRRGLDWGYLMLSEMRAHQQEKGQKFPIKLLMYKSKK